MQDREISSSSLVEIPTPRVRLPYLEWTLIMDSYNPRHQNGPSIPKENKTIKLAVYLCYETYLIITSMNSWETFDITHMALHEVWVIAEFK